MYSSKKQTRIAHKVERREKSNVDYLQSIDCSPEQNRLIERYKKLRILNKLQKNIVRQSMHNAMSPISAISGYLELMNMSLDRNMDVERIDRYREKIENGLNELNAILEQLHETFSERESEEHVDEASNIDLDNLVGEGT